ncbi:hypothetical protein ROLI_045140 (plasmid) [Roseobacter fucihabitans]|uniref:TIGR03016 family PEP-CTERM system-associated outer membrane protein n=1 Tax=Roseobacter fucihabitans TaxID=1537242 RepID=A0ABZ2BZ82_9RHOB|nr:hypothetical protein [Roseobacter litoralis]MBC6966915.1 hypothetical protein [Roseobacter litoralis]
MSFWYRNGVCSNKTHSRRHSNTGSTYRRIGAFAALCGIGVMAHAQEALPPGIIASFDITQRLEYSDNPDLVADGEADFFGRTVLGFGLQSATSLENFALNLGTDIEEGRKGTASSNLTNPFAQLSYERATRSASVGLALRYRESDVSSSFLADDFASDGSIINQSTGTRQSYGFDLSGAVGRDAPIGASFDLSYDERTFSGTSDPDLTDENTLDLSAQLDFRIDPRITTRLTTKYRDFDAQGNGTNRKTTGFGAGAELLITPTLLGDLFLSQDRIERSGEENAVDEGLSFGGSLTQTLKTGSIGVSLDSELSTNSSGRRTSLSLNRSRDFAGGAVLSYSLGATRSQDGGINPLMNVDYAYALSTSRITLGLSQSVNTDSDNREEINTSLRAGYTRQINTLSSLSADFSFFNRNELGAGAEDGQRVNLGLSYQYALTRDWGLVGGVSHTLISADDEADRSANTVFVGLQRNFTWNP